MTDTNTTAPTAPSAPAANPKAELTAMQAVSDAIADLDPAVAARVLRWALDSHGLSGARKGGNAEQGAETNGTVRRFADLAELHSAAAPETDADRALVAAYWFQFVEGQPDFGSQQINTALKNLGHPIANIASAFDPLKNRKPAPVVQLRKAGSTKQARKTFKLTVAGKQAVEMMIGQH